MTFQIVEVKPGSFALRRKGWLWGWNYVRDSADGSIFVWQSAEHAEAFARRLAARSDAARVVRTIVVP